MLGSSGRGLNRSVADTCTTLDELKPNISSWFVKVLVTEKTPIRSTKWGKQQRLVFVDKKKESIQGVIYDADIDQLNKIVQLYKTYYIGNGRIKELTTSTSNMAKSKYQIILNRSSYIKRTSEREELPLDHIYELTSFAECPQLADVANTRINLLCGVIHVFPPRFIQKNNRMVQDFVIINEERRPTILTLWEEFVKSEASDLTENIANMPVILGMRLSVYQLGHYHIAPFYLIHQYHRQNNLNYGYATTKTMWKLSLLRSFMTRTTKPWNNPTPHKFKK
ncbi:hypothetical protein ACS0TY_001057 [Phlomoides rotata]